MDLKKVWENVLLETQGTVSAMTYDNWLSKTEAVCIADDELLVSADSDVTVNVVETRYTELLRECTKKVAPKIRNLKFVSPAEKSRYEGGRYISLEELNEDSIVAEEYYTNFVPKYTFDSFIVGKSNEFAAAASKAVAENPGVKYNPLFLYGGVGLGKTHLMHAIGNFLKKSDPTLKCMYTSSERFTNDLIEALRASKKADEMKEFRRKYRSVDVLMIDDIQFISRTVATQEELFHVFNDLYFADKQIIISSDRPPQEINPLEERLRTRFQGGLIADIQPPDLEMRMAILQTKALSQNQQVDDDVLSLIANKVKSNIREMEGLLTKVISYAHLTNRSVNDPEVVAGALRDYGDDKPETVTIDRITDEVCAYFNVSKADLVGKKKTKDVVEPRQIAIYLVTEFLTTPLITIGEHFGNRDHTTVMYARDKISEKVKEDGRIARQIKDLKNMIMKR